MSENSDNFMIGDMQISPQHNTISRGEIECRLQPKVMALLHYLHINRERVIGNDELLEHVWEGRVVTHNSIQKSINALRAAFSKFDASGEYVVYFSKRGYQLVMPIYNQQGKPHLINKMWGRPVFWLVLVVFIITALYLAYFIIPSMVKRQPAITPLYLSQFTQVKPYISNTGRERIIEPHIGSERVAFIRDEPLLEGGTQSRLYIQGASGQEWQLSVARGQFVDIAWSASGRNLVAIDSHGTTEEIQGAREANTHLGYYTFHIFTLDFKGEKLIEKNLLSHWLGEVSSVTWWDEGTLEFVASQSKPSESACYRYKIAEQNLIELESNSEHGQLVASQVLDKVVARLVRLKDSEQVQFYNQQQKLLGQRTFPQQIVSMSWMSNGSGLLVLFDDGQLSILQLNGSLLAVNYTPKLDGPISRARSTDHGKSLVLTVDTSSIAMQSLPLNRQHKANSDDKEFVISFMAKGGGFIYTAAPKN